MEIIREQRNQDLSWFLDMYEAGKLELTPRYQRKSVWGAKDRKFFLDTIFNNFPCPAIYLQKEITDTKIIYNVVDGKQRLQTVIEFYQNKLRIPSSFEDARLANKKWKDIESETDLKYKFYNYPFSVEQLQCNGDVQWDEVFNRVNRNQKTLKDQELRHARFNGWFIKKAEAEAADELWKTLRISTTGREKRMQDVEFISILMLVMLEQDFVGFPQENIDKLYVKYDFESIDELMEDDTETSTEEGGEEIISKLSIEKFEEDFPKVKTILQDVISNNTELMNYIAGKPLTHVYTLWAVIALNLQRNIESSHLSARYCELLKECKKFDPKNLPDFSQASSDMTIAYKYYSNTTGAGTEKGPRKNRHDALMEFLGWS